MSKHIKTVLRELRNAIFALCGGLYPIGDIHGPVMKWVFFSRQLPIIFPWERGCHPGLRAGVQSVDMLDAGSSPA
jgi:hypothetical protein